MKKYKIQRSEEKYKMYLEIREKQSKKRKKTKTRI